MTTLDAWRGFVGDGWRQRIDVAAFIRHNYTPYEGDAAFLSGPTPRTTALWDGLGPLFAAAWTATAARWSPARRSGSCRRCTTSAPHRNRT